MTKVYAIECPKCGEIIYSRARHDFTTCSCGAISIDGGFDYTKICAATDIDMDKLTKHEIELPISRAELYRDWNLSKDRYGRIPACGQPLASLPSSAESVA